MNEPLRYVDAHIHFWDRTRFRYRWLEEAGPEFPASYLPEHVAGDGAHAEALVFVQADCDPDQGKAEAAWAADHVQHWSDRGAIVAFAPLEDVEALPQWIEELQHIPAVSGVRRLLQDEPPELLASTGLVDGLNRVAAAGLVFDACVRHPQLEALLALRRAAPIGTIVLDHLGKPPVRDGWGSPAAERWHTNLRHLAAESNVVVKLSGLAPECDPGRPLDQVDPFLQAAIDAFGPDRCMAGSDFPVSKVGDTGVDYDSWFDYVGSLVAPGAERDAVLRTTALRTYRL